MHLTDILNRFTLARTDPKALRANRSQAHEVVRRLKGATYSENDLLKSNLIVSAAVDYAPASHHNLVIDIDYPAFLFPSTTEGHSHLLIHKPIPAEKYAKLLEALEDCGLISAGVRGQLKNYGATRVRVPWIRKVSNGPSEGEA